MLATLIVDWFHTMQTRAAHVPAQAWPAFKALVADMRDAPTFKEGQRRFHGLFDQYQGLFPEACRCLAEDTEASLNHRKVPARHRPYVRTSNLAERAFGTGPRGRAAAARGVRRKRRGPGVAAGGGCWGVRPGWWRQKAV